MSQDNRNVLNPQEETVWSVHASTRLENNPGFTLQSTPAESWREVGGHLEATTTDHALAQKMAHAFIGKHSASLIARVKYELYQYLIDLMMEEQEGKQRTTQLAKTKYESVQAILNTLEDPHHPLYQAEQALSNQENLIEKSAEIQTLKRDLHNLIFPVLKENYRLTASLSTPGGRLATRLHHCIDLITQHDEKEYLKPLSSVDQGLIPFNKSYTLTSRALTDETYEELKRFAVALTGFSGKNYLVAGTEPALQKLSSSNTRTNSFNPFPSEAKKAKKAVTQPDWHESNWFREKNDPNAALRLKILKSIQKNRKSFLKRVGISGANFILETGRLITDFVTEPFRYTLQESVNFSDGGIWWINLIRRALSKTPYETLESTVDNPPQLSAVEGEGEEIIPNQSIPSTGIENGFIVAPSFAYHPNQSTFIVPTLFYYVDGVIRKTANIGLRNPVKLTISIAASGAFFTLMAIASQQSTGATLISNLVDKLFRLQFSGHLGGLSIAAKLSLATVDVITQPQESPLVQVKGVFNERPFDLIFAVGTATGLAGNFNFQAPELVKMGPLDLNADALSNYYLATSFGEQLQLGKRERIHSLFNKIIRAPLQIASPVVRFALSFLIGNPKKELYNLTANMLAATSFFAKIFLRTLSLLFFTTSLVTVVPRAMAIVAAKIIGTFASNDPKSYSRRFTNWISDNQVNIYENFLNVYQETHYAIALRPQAYIDRAFSNLLNWLKPRLIPITNLKTQTSLSTSDARIATLSSALEHLSERTRKKPMLSETDPTEKIKNKVAIFTAEEKMKTEKESVKDTPSAALTEKPEA